MNYQNGTGQYIWLRYATQYSKDGRTHTVEMGISVPLGASAETREKLLREAETGMSQLIQRVEQHVEQALGHVQSSHTPVKQGAAPIMSQPSQSSAITQAEPTASSPVTPSTAQPTQSVPDQSTPIQARPANRSASVPAPQTTTHVPNVQRTLAPIAQAVDVPPTRHSVGASMPSSLSPVSAGGSLTIPDFLSYIKEDMHLDSKQAMALLRVKSLAGINLREALENLKRIVAQNEQGRMSAPPPPPPPQQQVSVVREPHPVVSTPVSYNIIPSTPLPAEPSQPMVLQRQDIAIDELPTGSADEALEKLEQGHEANEIEVRVAQPVQPARGFDEETDENEDLEDLDDFENSSLTSEITPEQLSRARDKINSLRETQGAATASAARLQVLRNAADDEVSTQQLEELVVGVWHIQSLKKLKMDQVEALISWAKQDDFLDEVEAVLIVLEEERYARGNR